MEQVSSVLVSSVEMISRSFIRSHLFVFRATNQLSYPFTSISLLFLQTEYVHMLNATMCAVSRAICALLENYQTEEGIALPPVLKPLLPEGLDFLKFVKSAPIEEKPEAKKQKKKTKNKQGAQSDTCLEAKMETMDVSKE